MHRVLRTTVLAAALVGSAAALPAAAQTVGYNIRTGDVWVDNRLGEIDQYGRTYREPFINEITGYYGAPRSVVEQLLARRGWSPDDVYYACSIARSLGRSCLDIANEYDRDDGRGWGVTAKRLGIKPGSPAFHALKRGTVATYDRWGRPITLTSNAPVRWDAPKGKAPKALKTAGRDVDHAAMGHGPSKGGKPDHAGKGHGKGHGKGGGNGNGKGSGKG